MILSGELSEKLDYALFDDTQEEPESVYKHLEWLCSLGDPPILTDPASRLGDDLIDGKNGSGQRFASIPAFTSATPGQTGGMLRRQCTAEYKFDVCEKIIRRQVVGLEPRQRMPKVVQYFGLSRMPGTVANRNLTQAMYLHRSCLPLSVVDIGEKDVSGGVAEGECEGMCGL